jgi:hypothetical protein
LLVAPTPTTTHDAPTFDQAGRQLPAGPDRPAPAPLVRPPSTPQPSVERERSTSDSLDAEPSTAPSPELAEPGVKRELQRLTGHNSSGQHETSARSSRIRQPPTRFGYFTPLTDDDDDLDFAYLETYDDNDDPDLPDDFEMLFHEFEAPAWNEDSQCFKTTPELESSNPFANGFSLTPDHSSWQPFKTQQKMHPDDKDAGFYAIPGAYLGYKPTLREPDVRELLQN